MLYSVQYVAELLQEPGLLLPEGALRLRPPRRGAARALAHGGVAGDPARGARGRGRCCSSATRPASRSGARWATPGRCAASSRWSRPCGKRKGYKVFGLIDYFTGRLFAHGHDGRFTAESYCAFLATVLAATDRPLVLVQDGARYHTAQATRDFFAAHAARLTVHQLPAYSPDYNPIEHLWRNIKRQNTHNRYFPTFADPDRRRSRRRSPTSAPTPPRSSS